MLLNIFTFVDTKQNILSKVVDPPVGGIAAM
jgi:hypothetical protein